jgi:hypothetical protein
MTNVVLRNGLNGDRATHASLINAAVSHAPYERAMIAAYMAAELSKYQPNFLWKIDQWLLGSLEDLLILGLFGGFITALMFSYAPEQWEISPLIPAWCAGIGVAALAIMLTCSMIGMYGPAQWSLYQLKPGLKSYYSELLKREEPVPQFVTEAATRIKALIPEAKFEVAALEQERINLDPILFAITDQGRYPVKIWKENKEITFL